MMTLSDGVRGAIVCRARGVSAAAAMLCALALGVLTGCTSSEGLGSLMIDPGHYSVYHCDALAKQLTALIKHEQDLSNLISKASDSGGGAVVANLSYRADYENTLGEERVLRRTAAEKKCDLPPPATEPTPATYTVAPGQAAVSAPAYQSVQGAR
jgi:hypothetical protein